MFGMRILASLIVISALSTVGCGKKEEPQPGPNTAGNTTDDNGPKTLAEATEKLAKHRDALAASYSEGDVKAADKAWHAMAPVARKTKELATAAELDRYDKKTAEQAADQLVEILMTLHPPHGANAKIDPADYEKESDSINDAITNLEAIVAKTAESAAAE